VDGVLMNLKAFREKNNLQKAMIVGSVVVVLLIAIVVVVRTYAFYETKQEYNVIQGNVTYQESDINVTAYVDGNPSLTFPSKDGEYAVDHIECSNGAQAIWNYTNWEVNVQNLTNTKTKCKVYFVKRYKEDILNGTDPIISDNLIPVTINDDGNVIKANMEEEWYSYGNKEWANAVILEDENIIYQNGEEIPESNIESYFVWIPRYKYKIFNDGNYVDQTAVENRVQTIEIEFENKSTSVSDGSTVGSWLTHPAFTSFNSNGMWVGKFETGYKGATSKQAAQVNNNDSSKIEIKPNVYSWRSVQIANAFTASYNYQRDMDSHMMKNTEWGAVAYLSQSKYGSQKSVRINNNSAYITGYSAVSEPTCGYIGANEDCNKYESTTLNIDGAYTKRYNSDTGYLASTTGNISGIYDMSGGTWECVMGVLLDQSGKPMSGRNELSNSGFNGPYGCPSCDTASGNDSSKTSLTTGIPFPDAKYYDTYVYATNDVGYQRRILGDATGEMGPFAVKIYGMQNRRIGSWYADEAWFVNYGNPWFNRGTSATVGLDAGVFAFGHVAGAVTNEGNFRIVLAL